MRARQSTRVLPSTRRLSQRAEIVRRVRLGEARHGRAPEQRRRRRHGDHAEHATCVRGRRRALRVMSRPRPRCTRRG